MAGVYGRLREQGWQSWMKQASAGVANVRTFCRAVTESARDKNLFPQKIPLPRMTLLKGGNVLRDKSN